MYLLKVGHYIECDLYNNICTLYYVSITSVSLICSYFLYLLHSPSLYPDYIKNTFIASRVHLFA